MKPLVILAVSSVLLLAQGCTSFDKDKAGVESSVTVPSSATGAPVAGNVPPVTPVSDPAANGGSSLPAASPYSQPNGAIAQQNINPAPFMTAAGGQAPGGATTGAALITSGSLTSRADGTMSGPNDQPPATTGWGTPGPQAIPTAPSAKPATQPAKVPPK